MLVVMVITVLEATASSNGGSPFFSLYLAAETREPGGDLTSGKQQRETLLWLKVEAADAERVRQNDHLVTRVSDGGGVELLVRSEPILTQDGVSAVLDDLDHLGEPAVRLLLAGGAAERLMAVTDSNVGGHIAIVVNGQVHSVARIVAPVRDFIIVERMTTKDFGHLGTLHGWNAPTALPHDTRGSKKPTLVQCIVMLVLAVGVLIAGLVPAKGLKPSKRPYTWLFAGALLGCLLGTAIMGFRTMRYTLPDSAGLEAVGTTLTFSLVRGLLGGAFGAALGTLIGLCARVVLRRALFNIKRQARVFTKKHDNEAVSNDSV